MRIKETIAPQLNARINASNVFLGPIFADAIAKKSISPIPIPPLFVMRNIIRKKIKEKAIAFKPENT